MWLCEILMLEETGWKINRNSLYYLCNISIDLFYFKIKSTLKIIIPNKTHLQKNLAWGHLSNPLLLKENKCSESEIAISHVSLTQRPIFHTFIFLREARNIYNPSPPFNKGPHLKDVKMWKKLPIKVSDMRWKGHSWQPELFSSILVLHLGEKTYLVKVTVFLVFVTLNQTHSKLRHSS